MSARANASRAVVYPLPPLRLAGNNLGIESEPTIHFADRTGEMWETQSVESILRNIDAFEEERDRYRLLAGAALHYGLDVWALIDGRDHEQEHWKEES